MRKKREWIQGSQQPNSVGPECIITTKVYDWVVLRNHERNKVPIPKSCVQLLKKCRHYSGTLKASCEEVPCTRSCDVIQTKPIEIGVPSAKIVTIAFHTHLCVTFHCKEIDDDCDCKKNCSFTVPVTFVDDIILCHPEGTNIKCNIFDVQCKVILNEMLGDMVILDVTMCKDVQVEAEVKLEIEAKFCGPREVIPIQDVPVECPFPTFPEQCEFFPPENCECQGSASIDEHTDNVIFNGTQAIGNLTLETVICDLCTLAGSHLFARFEEDLSPTPAVSQSFTFVATQFDMPGCEPPFATLTVNGTGTYHQAGQQSENATFQLTLNEGPPGTVILVITTPTQTVTISETADEINVQECVRFN